MANHDELFAHASSHLMATFGDPTEITITPDGGLAVTMTAILGRVVISDDGDGDGIEQRRTREVKVLRDPAGAHGGIASLLSNATFTIDSQPWRVDTENPAAIETGPTWHTVQLISVGSVERTRPNYRR